MSKKPLLLMILDGWGINHRSEGNAVVKARTPNFDRLLRFYPSTSLEASGLAVGLPEGQMGNSEVGHLNLGAGRIVYQELTRINKDIESGNIFKNPVLREAMEKAKASGNSLHLMGLLSDGGVHSHIEHVKALLKMAKSMGLNKVFVHAFLDGRDVPPASAGIYIEQLEDYMDEIGVGQFATISGRYYAMDRDKRWDRTEKAYNALVFGEGLKAGAALEALKNSYEKDVTDEFVIPTVITDEAGKPQATVEPGDSIIFFNFRPDRARQLSYAFCDDNFQGFVRRKGRIPVHYVCMTCYDVELKNSEIAYKPQSLDNILAEVLAKEGLKQLRIAETEKYAHVTFFFNGGVEKSYPGEDRILIPSPKVATYDLRPEMSAYEVTEKVIEQIKEDKYDVIIMNYANPDMVGHTGVFEAAKKAVETIDECIEKVEKAVREKNGILIITADHGNAEKMVDYDTNEPHTAHTNDEVPFILIGECNYRLRRGKLADVAPTILHLLNIEKPPEMTGKSLIEK